MAAVYLVEDEANIRELVVYTLKASGFEAEGFDEADSFFNAVRKKMPDAVILDIMLPGKSGLEILKEIRQSKTLGALPVMMLTAKSTEYDKVLGLDAGADDYLAKPFGMMEMVARIRALLRRAQQGKAKDEPLSAGGVELVPQKHMVLVNGQEVTLTLKEYELLALFLENPGIVFTRDNLLGSIWGYEYSGETRTVDVHIRSLRQKLGEGAALIETVRGVGYKLNEGGEAENEKTDI